MCLNGYRFFKYKFIYEWNIDILKRILKKRKYAGVRKEKKKIRIEFTNL